MTDAQTEARAIWSAARNHWLKAGRHGTQEAADDIAADIIATALAAKDAKLAAQLAETQRAWNERDGEKRLRLRAEAQLAEANKALENTARSAAVAAVDAIHGYTMEFASSPAQHQHEYDVAESAIRNELHFAARRAREAQGGDDVL